MIDNDSGFVTRARQADRVGRLAACASSPAPVPPEELVAMKLNALVIDPAVLGEDGWAYLERICGMLPDLGGGRLHRPLDASPSGSAACGSAPTTGSASPATQRR